MPADLFEAYVAGRAGAFFDVALDRAEQRRAAVERACRPLAPAVLAGLRAQNERFGPSAARAAHLAALAQGAAVVVTGQQVGLFLGPLYTLYKTASAIGVARALAAESGRPVVPLFWLQSEDHDLPEIASCAIPRAQNEPLTLRVAVAADNKRSIAQLTLPAEVDDHLATLESELGKLPHARAYLDRLKRHYRIGAGWVEAFAGVLAELFEPEGLLLLDPRDPALAGACAAIHERALRAAPQLADALLERSRALERAGFATMVHVRRGAPLSFFHSEGPNGPRYRLVPSGPERASTPAGESLAPPAPPRVSPVASSDALDAGSFVHGGTGRGEPLARGRDAGAAPLEHGGSGGPVFAEVGGSGEHPLPALLQRLQREPGCFSTSALLRPILQDALLPTAAYVAGPGELAYFAQLQPLYRAYGLAMPLLVPRARFWLIEAGAGRLLERYQLDAAALALPEAELLNRIAEREAASESGRLGAALLESHLREGFERVLAEGVAQVGPLASQLEAAVAKTREKVQMSAAKLAEKYAAALARHDHARLADVRRLQHMLQPQGQPQERFYGLPYFAARYGERALIERVLGAIDPFAGAQQELTL